MVNEELPVVEKLRSRVYSRAAHGVVARIHAATSNKALSSLPEEPPTTATLLLDSLNSIPA